MNVALMLVAVLAALINCMQLTTPTHNFNFFPLTMNALYLVVSMYSVEKPRMPLVLHGSCLPSRWLVSLGTYLPS